MNIPADLLERIAGLRRAADLLQSDASAAQAVREAADLLAILHAALSREYAEVEYHAGSRRRSVQP